MERELIFNEINIEERKNFINYLLLADENEEIVNEYINNGDLFSITVLDKVVGVAIFISESPKTIELKNIALLADYRGKGLGKEILKLASALYKNKSFKKMTVGTANSSIDNIAFYLKAGFRIVGIRKGFFAKYPEPIYENGIQAIDMIMFEKDL